MCNCLGSVARTATVFNLGILRLALILLVLLLDRPAGCGKDFTSYDVDSLYVVSNQVQCIESASRYHPGLPELTLEGWKYPLHKYEQAFERWSFDLQNDQNQRAFRKSSLGILKTEIEPGNRYRIARGTDLLVYQGPQPRMVSKGNPGVWNWKSATELPFDLDAAIGFDRTCEHAVIPWHGSVALVTIASLEVGPLLAEVKTNWNIALSFSKNTYHHALLSQDGSRLIFFPEGSSPVGRQVLVLDAHGSQIIKLPDGLRWNDLLDAEVINGALFFVTRNFSGANLNYVMQSSPADDDSHQITDSSWNVLANLPDGSGWRRPLWDVAGQRLIFQELWTEIKDADPAIRFRIWNYQTGKDIIVTVNSNSLSR